MDIKWDINKNYMVGKTSNVNIKNGKIAAFDLDDTLIKTKSGKDFSIDEFDWEMYDKSIVEKLNKLSKDDYNLVIISNQMGISKGKVTIEALKNKIDHIVNFIKLDFTVICAFNDDNFRKPRTKMWDFILGNVSNSFYCGDAGGLAKRNINNKSIDKDFSDTDLKFAKNIGLKFIHRDEFVYNIQYNDNTYKLDYPISFEKLSYGANYDFKPNHPEVILNVGLPASGKSHFTLNAIKHNYEHINQDTLKTAKKCINVTESALKLNKSVIIDNTNLTKENRKVFIELANKYKIKCRCFIFTTPVEICKHNSYFRNYITNGEVSPIPNIVYNMMKKKYIKPEINEGFYEINEVNFSLNLSDSAKELYKKYYF
jgi:bifunctional polynucleotide phosphatase/kinase